MPNCSPEKRKEQRNRYYAKFPGGAKAGTPWMPEEDALLKQLDITDAELTRLLGRSMGAVQMRRSRLRALWDIPSKATPDDGIAYEKKYAIRKKSRQLSAIGELQKKPCEKCGSASSEIHHPEYSDPRLIVWLCGNCHDREHIEQLRRQRQLPIDPSCK